MWSVKTGDVRERGSGGKVRNAEEDLHGSMGPQIKLLHMDDMVHLCQPDAPRSDFIFARFHYRWSFSEEYFNVFSATEQPAFYKELNLRLEVVVVFGLK